jgi:hypothetical protein
VRLCVLGLTSSAQLPILNDPIASDLPSFSLKMVADVIVMIICEEVSKKTIIVK